MRTLSIGVSKAAIAACLLAVSPVVVGSVPVIGASEAFADTVSSIQVQGNQRVDADTVRSYMTIKPGRGFGAKDVDDSIKALFATGLFSDVQISRGGGALVVKVVESPLINRISFEGNKRLTDEQLGVVVESRPRGLMSRAKVQSDVQRVLEAYRRSGRFRASVEPKIIELPQNRVDLVFEVNEGDKTGVSQINFVGNGAFSDGRLRDVVKTRESGILSWIRSTDTYDPDRLNADQELLRRFYMKNGYADFRVLSANADLDREGNTFYVTFAVEEGEQYRFGEIDVQSSIPEVDANAIRGAVRTSAGGVYNAEEVEKSVEDLAIAAARGGYAFASIRPRATRDYANKTISITYYVEEGPRVYVERINVRGNTRTRDYVVRREFDMVEGDAFNRVMVDRAERRLRNLTFFKNVRVTTEQGSSPDRVIVNVDVDEQPTGEISFGVGYSSADGVIGDLSVSEKNFLGRGQFVRATIGMGESKRNYELSFTEPYFMGYRLSAGFDLYQRENNSNSYRNYDEDTRGGGIRFGLPITDAFTVGVGYSLYQQEISVAPSYADGNAANGEISTAIKQFLQPNNACGGAGGACTVLSGKDLISQANWNLTYNTIDNIQFPRDGILVKFNQDIAGLGGDVGFVKTTLDARYYKELVADWGLVGMLRARAGYVTGMGKGMRLFDQFYIGGETIRGFESSGIGPRDATTRESLGANTYVAVTAEATAPIPFLPEELGFYGSVFADAGAAWGIENRLKGGATVIGDSTKIRSSAGVGIIWRSPFGPLRADFAYPISKEKGDQTQVFRFSGGTQF